MAGNPNIQQTPATYLRTCAIIHLALTIGQVLFAIVAIFQSKKIMINVRNIHDPLLYLVPLFAVSGSVLGNVLYKSKVNSIPKTDSLKGKLTAYQSAMIIRFALLEGPSLFGIVAFMLTGELFFLIVSAMLIIYFIYLKPTKSSIQDALDFSYQEQDAFNQPDKVLN